MFKLIVDSPEYCDRGINGHDCILNEKTNEKILYFSCVWCYSRIINVCTLFVNYLTVGVISR